MKSILADRNNYDHYEYPAIPNYDAELELHRAWQALEAAEKHLVNAVRLSNEPNHMDHESRSEMAAWNAIENKLSKAVSSAINVGFHPVSRLTACIPDDLLTEGKK